MGARSQRDVFSLFIIRRQPSMKRPEGVRMGHGLSEGSLLTERCFLSFYYTA